LMPFSFLLYPFSMGERVKEGEINITFRYLS